MYRIREVDAAEEDDVITELHILTFFDAAPIPDLTVGNWWIAFKGSAPVGFAGLIPSDHIPGAGYFSRVGVLPGHTGGMQLRFMRAIERRARKDGMEQIVSDTTDNIRSANNFIAAGWRLFAPPEPWAMLRSLYWRKRLR
jgi:hypothetical protein